MGELLNLIGLSTGIVLYAMLLVMVVRAARADAALNAGGRIDPLLLATAVLGLIWNLCALPAYELPEGRHRRSVSVPHRDRLQRARVSSGGRRAFGAARRREDVPTAR